MTMPRAFIHLVSPWDRLSKRLPQAYREVTNSEVALVELAKEAEVKPHLDIFEPKFLRDHRL